MGREVDPGGRLVGDAPAVGARHAAGMVNVPKLKGIHLAMHSGMFAAEAIVEALKRGSTEDLAGYQHRIQASVIASDLHRSRNMRQPFTRGFAIGAAIANLMELTGGRFPAGRWHTETDAFVGDRDKRYPRSDRKLTFDKLGSVFLSGNATRDDAPNHIRIERKVPLAVGLMWQHMCPAGVYEVPEETLEHRGSGAARATASSSTSTSRRPTASSAARSPPTVGGSRRPRAAKGRATRSRERREAESDRRKIRRRRRR